MQVGAQPWYYTVIQWVSTIVSLLYPIAMVVILGLALAHFKRLVDHYAPKEDKAVASSDTPKKGAQEKEMEF